MPSAAGLPTFVAPYPLGVWGDVGSIVAGVLLVVWPLQYRWSMSRARARLSERGGDVQRFETIMDRWWIRVALRVAPVVGVLLIVVGVLSLAF